MTAEHILIESNGCTGAAHTSCGDVYCTEAILRTHGVPDSVLEARGTDLSNEEIAEEVFISVVILGESDQCEHCAACGDFIRHGIRYEGGGIGCTCPLDEDGDVIDPEPRDGPHPDLAGHPAMRPFLSSDPAGR